MLESKRTRIEAQPLPCKDDLASGANWKLSRIGRKAELNTIVLTQVIERRPDAEAGG